MDLIQEYQKSCKYRIDNHIQKLEHNVDIETLRREIFSLITRNNYGMRNVSLRLPAGNTDWLTATESLESNAVNSHRYDQNTSVGPVNTLHNKEYMVWHPDLQGSYIEQLSADIENFTGFNVGRIRLGWLQPQKGYPMHADLDPLRLHIPILTNKLAYIIHDDTLTHMEYGKLYHLITTLTHTAHNFGQVPRLHLIFSTYGDDNLDSAISQVIDPMATEKNFYDHVANEGYDDFAIREWYKIAESSIPDSKKTEFAQHIIQMQRVVRKYSK